MQPTDAIWQDIINLNLDYLSYAGGITSNAPDDVQNANVEMWKLDQIYRLRSEIIELSLIIDKKDEIIQEQIRKGFETIAKSLEEKESNEPLKIRSISFDKQANNENDQYISSQKISSYSRPISPSMGILQKNKYDNGTIKKRTSSSRRTSSSQNKQLTKDSLWDNVDMFLKPIDNINDLDALLNDSKPIGEQKWLQEPLGQHYSLTMKRNINYLSDPLKEKLIVPHPPGESSETSETSAYLQSRLISSVVPKIGKETLQLPEMPSFKNENNLNSFSKDLQFAENNVTPPSDSLDFSGYGKLKFDEKLMLELKYVGIEINEKTKLTEDCPILKEMMYLFDNEKESIDKTNKLKQIVHEIFEKKKYYLEERQKKHNEWILTMNHFRQNDKTK